MEDHLGEGPLVERHRTYKVQLRMWLPKGEPVKFSYSSLKEIAVEDEGATYIGPFEVHRGRTIAGLFYGVEGMRVGGQRKLKVSPHLAYGKEGMANIPGNAALIIEITILE